MASLGVALTVTPALALLLLGGRGQGAPATLPETEGPWLLRKLQAGYVRLLRRLDHEAPLLVTVAVLLFVAAVGALFDTGGEFLPELRENHFVVHMRGLPGMSLAQSLRGGERAARLIRTDRLLCEQVRSIAQQAGRAE